MRLELVPLRSTDVDRSKAFYVDQVGFTLDHDVEPGNGMRVVQLTPPGSACSVVISVGMSDPHAAPVLNLHLVVDNVEHRSPNAHRQPGWTSRTSATWVAAFGTPTSAIRTATPGPCSRSRDEGSRGQGPGFGCGSPAQLVLRPARQGPGSRITSWAMSNSLRFSCEDSRCNMAKAPSSSRSRCTMMIPSAVPMVERRSLANRNPRPAAPTPPPSRQAQRATGQPPGPRRRRRRGSVE